MGLNETLKLIDDLAVENLIDKPYIVGGLPRDIYMKNKIKTTDIDLTTNSSEVLRLGILLAERLNVTFELSDDGHVTVFTDDFDIDFSSHFVSDAVVSFLDGKHKGLEEAYSRDFTINTLHQDLVTRKITDPTGLGVDDVNKRLIRTPVPARITLSDDPRRIYRAINLAARYGFKIDKDIQGFVKDNIDMFTSEGVKDKYISLKIDKALKEDEDYTIKLLKDLGLFKSVPLVGRFKEILIERKLLAEYLGDSEKRINNLLEPGDDWAEYSAQGPEHKALADWWKQNYFKVPGSWSKSYEDWKRWYMDKYHGEWGGQHKHPDEVLKLLSQGEPTLTDREQRKRDIDRLFRGLFGGQRQETRSPGPTITGNYLGKIRTSGSHVNLDNTTVRLKQFLQVLGDVAEQRRAATPIITSGYRDPLKQVSVMFKNWKNNGGSSWYLLNRGRSYLTKLYGKGYGSVMDDIFSKYMKGDGTLDERAYQLGAAEVAKRMSKNSHGGKSGKGPGAAVDIAMTSGIGKVIDEIKQSGQFRIKVLNEGDHYHVSVRG